MHRRPISLGPAHHPSSSRALIPSCLCLASQYSSDLADPTGAVDNLCKQLLGAPDLRRSVEGMEGFRTVRNRTFLPLDVIQEENMDWVLLTIELENLETN